MMRIEREGSLRLGAAQLLADKVAAAMQPYCERIQVAGSVRRQRVFVNDLDFVVLIKPGQLMHFRERASSNATVVKSGEDIYIIRLRDGTQVDFYFAHAGTGDLLEAQPGNWGSVLLCRTGSKEHNIYLAQQAQRMGYKWETMVGLTTAPGTSRAGLKPRQVLASETEEDIFKALELDFIPPERRER